MRADFHRPSAKIFSFPVGGRSGRAARADTPAAQVCVVDTNGYHGAAIQEEAARGRVPKGR